MQRRQEEPLHKEARYVQRDQSPRQRNDESLGRPTDARRQRRKPHVDVENKPIREIDTIIGGSHVGGESKNAQTNYAREAKDPSMMSYLCELHIHT